MDNKEFCQLIRQAQKNSGTTTVDLIVYTRRSESIIHNALRCVNDTAVKFYIILIDAVKHVLCLNKDNIVIKIHNEDDILKWIKSELEKQPASAIKLGKDLGVSQATILNVLKGRGLHLQLFLRFVDYYGYKITLDAII